MRNSLRIVVDNISFYNRNQLAQCFVAEEIIVLAIASKIVGHGDVNTMSVERPLHLDYKIRHTRSHVNSQCGRIFSPRNSQRVYLRRQIFGKSNTFPRINSTFVTINLFNTYPIATSLRKEVLEERSRSDVLLCICSTLSKHYDRISLSSRFGQRE